MSSKKLSKTDTFQHDETVLVGDLLVDSQSIRVGELILDAKHLLRKRAYDGSPGARVHRLLENLMLRAEQNLKNDVFDLERAIKEYNNWVN